MTREQIVARIELALAAGVITSEQVTESLRRQGYDAPGLWALDQHLLITLNELLEENNVLTNAADTGVSAI